jgi:hypothetical protein
MRTTVTLPARDEATDPYDDCFGTVNDDGTLTIVSAVDDGVEYEYPAGDWASYEVEAE